MPLGLFTYAWDGKYGAGPTKLTPVIRITPPITDTAFGRTYLSHNQPHAGADRPYIAPVTTKTNPKKTGSRWNCTFVNYTVSYSWLNFIIMYSMKSMSILYLP